ncbi:substrate-binding domain-containing protein [Streptomyces sp. NPDC001604]|uniref:substrate-binding domain-containing protein n=1 Tax=Streptomyces sp. NPDC001604 TaxID=3364593 RepID=UPI0036C24A07
MTPARPLGWVRGWRQEKPRNSCTTGRRRRRRCAASAPCRAATSGRQHPPPPWRTHRAGRCHGSRRPQHLFRAGVSAPDAISVVGFDDSRLARLPHVDLTTITQGISCMTELAVTHIPERLEPYGNTLRRHRIRQNQ